MDVLQDVAVGRAVLEGPRFDLVNPGVVMARPAARGRVGRVGDKVPGPGDVASPQVAHETMEAVPVGAWGAVRRARARPPVDQLHRTGGALSGGEGRGGAQAPPT